MHTFHTKNWRTDKFRKVRCTKNFDVLSNKRLKSWKTSGPMLLWRFVVCYCPQKPFAWLLKAGKKLVYIYVNFHAKLIFVHANLWIKYGATHFLCVHTLYTWKPIILHFRFQQVCFVSLVKNKEKWMHMHTTLFRIFFCKQYFIVFFLKGIKIRWTETKKNLQICHK